MVSIANAFFHSLRTVISFWRMKVVNNCVRKLFISELILGNQIQSRILTYAYHAAGVADQKMDIKS